MLAQGGSRALSTGGISRTGLPAPIALPPPPAAVLAHSQSAVFEPKFGSARPAVASEGERRLQDLATPGADRSPRTLTLPEMLETPDSGYETKLVDLHLPDYFGWKHRNEAMPRGSDELGNAVDQPSDVFNDTEPDVDDSEPIAAVRRSSEPTLQIRDEICIQLVASLDLGAEPTSPIHHEQAEGFLAVRPALEAQGVSPAPSRPRESDSSILCQTSAALERVWAAQRASPGAPRSATTTAAYLKRMSV